MAKLDTNNRQVERLQENLQSIRRIAGWSAEDLGEKIGVTKQTIRNIENRKTKMTLTQYIAIRAVLECEVDESPENKLLGESISLLLDESGRMSPEEYQKAKNIVNTIAGAKAEGVEDETLLDTFLTLLKASALLGAGIALVPSPLGIVGGLWLKKLLGKEPETVE